MSKTITISFHASEHLRKALEKISVEEKRSLSSTIETILYNYTEGRNEFKQVQKENRCYPRRSVSVPALVSIDNEISAGIVLDISLGGLQISIPKGYQLEVKEGEENIRISIVFILPEIKKPLSVQCVPRHIIRSNGEATLGVLFEDADFINCQAFKEYIIN
jgi:hypothetical protein